MKKKLSIVVGLSGGVDSAVSAALLKRQGHRVIGIFMKNWNDSESLCQAHEDYSHVEKVCRYLNIPYYTISFEKEYSRKVFDLMVEGHRKGLTPNPDILCNKEIKFKAFFNQAMKLGADYLATGHYCRIDGDLLLRGCDPTKDQSYFLHGIDKEVLSQVLFPVGGLLKTSVRKMAREWGLPNYQKKDSTGICFIGKRNFKNFLSRYIPASPGKFERPDGEIVGTHDGAFYYTIGQRKGLGLGGPGNPWFVVGKDMKRNVVVVERGRPIDFYSKKLVADSLNFFQEPSKYPFLCQAKMRYRQPDQACVIHKKEKGDIFVSFVSPQWAMTPGQSIVFYRDEICLGGGVIRQVDF